MGIQGNQQMDMDDDDDDEHETKTDGVETTDRHVTGDSTASGFGRRSRRKSHAIIAPLVSDSEDGKTMIKRTGDM
jgi:hypothetical protein